MSSFGGVTSLVFLCVFLCTCPPSGAWCGLSNGFLVGGGGGLYYENCVRTVLCMWWSRLVAETGGFLASTYSFLFLLFLVFLSCIPAPTLFLSLVAPKRVRRSVLSSHFIPSIAI